MAKILVQQLWEMKVEWDDVIPDSILDVWLQWRNELDLLSSHHVPRCYYPKTVHVASMQLHGFSDASERAYAGVIYLRVTDSQGGVHVSLVTSKTKVAPIKRLTIPRLELCGAHLLAQLLHHVKEVFRIPLHKVHAWTDSTIVVAWLAGDSRRFKTYVGNRVSQIVDLIAPDRWKHVSGAQNPADCAPDSLLSFWITSYGGMAQTGFVLTLQSGPGHLRTQHRTSQGTRRKKSASTLQSLPRNLSLDWIVTPVSPS